MTPKYLTLPSLLRYKAYRNEQAELHATWRLVCPARRVEDEHLATIACGDSNPPPTEADQIAQREIGLLGLLQFLLYLSIGASSLVNSSWVSGTGDASVQQLWPTQQWLLSESHLAEFDGRVEGQHIYLMVHVLFFHVRYVDRWGAWR